jgi:hypothetical protein
VGDVVEGAAGAVGPANVTSARAKRRVCPFASTRSTWSWATSSEMVPRYIEPSLSFTTSGNACARATEERVREAVMTASEAAKRSGARSRMPWA